MGERRVRKVRLAACAAVVYVYICVVVAYTRIKKFIFFYSFVKVLCSIAAGQSSTE